MEVVLTDVQMDTLAAKIARAQLVAADTLIDEVTSTWSDTVKQRYHVPAPGETDRNGNPYSQIHRFEMFRSMRAGAEGMLQREKQEEEAAKAALAERAKQREAEEAATLQANLDHNAATLKAWEAECQLAKLQSRREPMKPTNLLPETGEALAQAAHRERMAQVMNGG